MTRSFSQRAKLKIQQSNVDLVRKRALRRTHAGLGVRYFLLHCHSPFTQHGIADPGANKAKRWRHKLQKMLLSASAVREEVRYVYPIPCFSPPVLNVLVVGYACL